jgi:hypothetical protein
MEEKFSWYSVLPRSRFGLISHDHTPRTTMISKKFAKILHTSTNKSSKSNLSNRVANEGLGDLAAASASRPLTHRIRDGTTIALDLTSKVSEAVDLLKPLKAVSEVLKKTIEVAKVGTSPMLDRLF